PTPRSSLLPYTTLFRSQVAHPAAGSSRGRQTVGGVVQRLAIGVDDVRGGVRLLGEPPPLVQGVQGEGHRHLAAGDRQRIGGRTVDGDVEIGRLRLSRRNAAEVLRRVDDADRPGTWTGG